MDYPLIWSVLIAVAVMLYVLLGGMDLGVGMLSFFAKGDEERNMMTATIEPVWDGNETWLILGGGGLFAAFPLAYSILMPAFYLPILIMLAALIFRGVAFEFRHKAVRRPTRRPSSSSPVSRRVIGVGGTHGPVSRTHLALSPPLTDEGVLLL